jgi:hypothetical protein
MVSPKQDERYNWYQKSDSRYAPNLYLDLEELNKICAGQEKANSAADLECSIDSSEAITDHNGWKAQEKVTNLIAIL